MRERPYVCETGHQLAHGVTTCPRCGTKAGPARRELTMLFALGLVALAVFGVAATFRGRSEPSADGAALAAATTEVPPPSWETEPEETTTTTEVPAGTEPSTPATTATTSAPASPTTSAAPTTTRPPATPAAPRAPMAGLPRRTVAPTPPPATTTEPAPPTPARRRAIARDAAVVAFTTGHAADGYPAAETLVSPELRSTLDRRTRTADYRRAGCRQRVEEVFDGHIRGEDYGFSLTLDRVCDRVPRDADGRILPLVTGEYATIALGPSPNGSVWAVGLSRS